MKTKQQRTLSNLRCANQIKFTVFLSILLIFIFSAISCKTQTDELLEDAVSISDVSVDEEGVRAEEEEEEEEQEKDEDISGDEEILVEEIEPPPSKILALSGEHTCGLNGGEAYCWGYNSDNQSGPDPLNKRSVKVPTTMGSNSVFTAITLGERHSCALDDDGAAWCWGSNSSATLGNGKSNFSTKSEIPVKVADDHVFIDISAGKLSNCAIDDTNDIWCWGANYWSLIDRESSVWAYVPRKLDTTHKFLSISLGLDHGCAIATTNLVWCWGNNSQGQLGNNDGRLTTKNAPVRINSNLEFSKVAVGSYHSCAIDISGDTWCWGKNANGQVGNDSTTNVKSPVKITAANFVNIIPTNENTVAIDDEGNLWAWGIGSSWVNGSTSQFNLPNMITAFTVQLKHLYSGPLSKVICGIDSSEDTYCWGSNNYTQFGNNSTVNSTRPIRVNTPF